MLACSTLKSFLLVLYRCPPIRRMSYPMLQSPQSWSDHQNGKRNTHDWSGQPPEESIAMLVHDWHRIKVHSYREKHLESAHVFALFGNLLGKVLTKVASQERQWQEEDRYQGQLAYTFVLLSGDSVED